MILTKTHGVISELRHIHGKGTSSSCQELSSPWGHSENTALTSHGICLILNFQPPERGGTHVCCLKGTRGWYFVTAARTAQDTALICIKSPEPSFHTQHSGHGCAKDRRTELHRRTVGQAGVDTQSSLSSLSGRVQGQLEAFHGCS